MYEELMAAAVKAREASYSPYSHFAVGAAVLCGDGRVFTGCNIENGAYSACICAERTAICKAVSEGERLIKAVAVCGGSAGAEATDSCPPCGECRQVISEFADEETVVVLMDGKGGLDIHPFGELLKLSFELHGN